jgi:hypothetical protein
LQAGSPSPTLAIILNIPGKALEERPCRDEEKTMLDRPQARTEGIIDERVDEDLVLYDRETRTAHSLSAAAALVWERCDGKRSATEIAHECKLEPALADQALAELSERGLLVELPESLISRRQAAKRLAKVGSVALVAPLIYSVAIPAAAAAASPTACAAVTCASGNTKGSAASQTAANAVCSTNTVACRGTSTCNCVPAEDGQSGNFTCTGTCVF